MTQIILIFLTALTFSVLATPLARRLALRTGVVDVPNARKVHAAPVPLLGGAAMYAGFMVALVLLGDRSYVRELVGIVLGATLVSLFGLADDRWGMHAYLKLGGQLLAGVVLILGGTQVRLFEPAWLNWAITLLWVVGITNALNLLDNMDGLSAGVTTVAAAFFLLLAAMSGQYLVGAMAAALVGACVGFLRYNLNPATIFMGDTGALFLGFLLAALAIKLRFPSNVPWVTWLVPVTVLAATARQEPAHDARQGPRLAPPGGARAHAARGGAFLLPDRLRVRHGGGVHLAGALAGRVRGGGAAGAGGTGGDLVVRAADAR
jgi:UDP-GlcNAc:undecaprenyl-phosphate/decaprenyl-phosphate GlcNAc-1-phosphate transferase